mmetsp:Transcript_778/g.1661  ORF Transcript_778/g.1661 Transcript_778/m.1661 type:complete len:414 (+) Transcript_778:103-1344(+)
MAMALIGLSPPSAGNPELRTLRSGSQAGNAWEQPQSPRSFAGELPGRLAIPFGAVIAAKAVAEVRSSRRRAALTGGVLSARREASRIVAVRAPLCAAASSDEEQVEEVSESGAGFLQAFWKFLRPHTIRGTILGSSAMVLRVLLERGTFPDLSLVPRAICGVIALLCGNGYIVGINQIYDVDIDVINKPFLPVAAKEISPGLAWVLILAMAGVGGFLAWRLFGSLIGGLYGFGLFLGTIYSVPPLRLKQFAIPAALIIAIVRGFLLNFGVYYATRAALGVPFSWSAPAAFITCFMSVFAIVIAVTKDLPDVKGDTENQIETFSTRFGVGKVSLAATVALIANYATSYAWALSSRTGGSFNPMVFLGSHTIFAAMLARGFLRLRAANFTEDALKAYYRLIWLLLYSEYCFFPVI